MSWLMVIYFIVLFVMMCAAQFAERRKTNALTAGGASPVASAPDPSAAKARGE
jgi:hypothetical protein